MVFDEQRFEQLHQLFDRYDYDKNGTMDRSELKQLFVDCGHDATTDDVTIDELLRTFGDDGDIVSFEIFCEVRQSRVSTPRTDASPCSFV